MTLNEFNDLTDRTLVIPLSAIPAQRFQCVLNNQNCTVTIKKRGIHCYFSLTSNGSVIAENVICLCGNNLVPYRSQSFDGSIFFVDMSGHYSTPSYKEFGTRYKLVYVPFRIDEAEILTDE